jgi:hypothetical protein
MDVKHCNLLSWFMEGESHEQDGETLRAVRASARTTTETASGDPAMAFEPSVRPDPSGPGFARQPDRLPDF